jgi:hypothetical protein
MIRYTLPQLDGNIIMTQGDYAKLKSKEVSREIHPTSVMNAIRMGFIDYTLPLPTDPKRNFFDAWDNNMLLKKGLALYVVYNEKARLFQFGNNWKHKQVSYIPKPLPFPTINGHELIDISEFFFRKGLEKSSSDSPLIKYYAEKEIIKTYSVDSLFEEKRRIFILWDSSASDLQIKRIK